MDSAIQNMGVLSSLPWLGDPPNEIGGGWMGLSSINGVFSDTPCLKKPEGTVMATNCR